MHIEDRDADEANNRQEFDEYGGCIDAGGFFDAHNQQRHQNENDRNRRQIDNAAHKRAFGQSFGKSHARGCQPVVEIPRPAIGNRRNRDAVFEDQVPGDDPGDQFTKSRIAVAISTAAAANT